MNKWLSFSDMELRAIIAGLEVAYDGAFEAGVSPALVNAGWELKAEAERELARRRQVERRVRP